MAKTDYSSILILGAVGAAAYYAYQQGWFTSIFSAPVPVIPVSTATPPIAVTPQPVITPVPVPVSADPTSGNSLTSVQALQRAAGIGVSKLNADQWQYYWNQLGRAAIPASVFTSQFFPNGRVGDAPLMTAAQFVQAIGSQGISGLGSYYGIPSAFIHRGYA